MSEPGLDPPEFGSAAERELHRKLEEVRLVPPAPEGHLEERVARTLRWQSLVVVPLQAGLAFAGGILAGLRSLSGGRSGS